VILTAQRIICEHANLKKLNFCMLSHLSTKIFSMQIMKI